MNWKRFAAITTCCVLALAAGWTFLVVNYETDLGTENTIMVSDAGGNASSATNDALVVLSFEEGAENLSWSSLQLSIVAGDDAYSCSFGSQSTQSDNASKVTATLGADGATFTTVIDATDEERFTHLDLPGQKETDEANSTLRFSKTDVFLASGVRWTFLEGIEFQDATMQNSTELSNETEDRLEWYTYDLAEHRVQPNAGVYLIEVDDLLFKVQFLSYYNQADESRHPTIKVAALNQTAFPALLDTDLVAPSPCLITAENAPSEVWGATESITLVENGVQICSDSCAIQIRASYETFSIEIKGINAID